MLPVERNTSADSFLLVASDPGSNLVQTAPNQDFKTKVRRPPRLTKTPVLLLAHRTRVRSVSVTLEPTGESAGYQTVAYVTHGKKQIHCKYTSISQVLIEVVQT